MPHGVYATAWECMEYLDIHDDQSFLLTDTRFLRFTLDMSRKFDTLAKRWFYPLHETRVYDHPDEASFEIAAGSGYLTSLPNVLPLDADLLSLIELKTNNGATIITSDNILLRTGNSYNFSPKDSIELSTNGTQTTFLYSGTPQEANTVEGIYGYHERFSDAWQTVDTIQDAAGINASVTTVTVADADAFDELGLKPRFQAQQLVRFGTANTSEIAYLTDVNYSADTLQVVRGVNGSTAAIAALSTAIQVFRPMYEIKHAMLVLASHAYRRKDSIGSGERESKIVTPSGMLIIPQQIPQEVADMVRAYKRPSPMW